MDRRDFVKVAGAELGLLAAAAACGRAAPPTMAPPPKPAPPTGRRDTYDFVVIGAGAFGGWTASHHQEAGARVLLVDQYGPGNSRATSGDETRGVRSSYGDRPTDLWVRWARRAMERWTRFDEEWATEHTGRLFFTTGDLIMRKEWDNFTRKTRELWEKLQIPHQVLPVDEVRARYPVIDLKDIAVVLYEPDAGVVRSRRACEAVAHRFMRRGGEVRVAHASLGEQTGRRMDTIALVNGDRVSAGAYCFACGPWSPKVFPALLGPIMQVPVGHVCYFGTPPGDERFTFPNLPSYNFPGVTGWPALVPDYRGFRVRTGGERQPDPDFSQRWVPQNSIKRNRAVLKERFPLLQDAPLIETRACHYEFSATRNFLIDKHPDYDNVWISGGGSAEGFKFGPVVGEYTANRILGQETDAELAELFSIPLEPPPPPARGADP
jgi:glycine/D-amino acid oxidase-like deaminating enzyme